MTAMSGSIKDLIQTHAFWVLVPDLKTTDPNLQYYYDFSQSHAEYTRVFEEIGATWHWQPVTMDDKMDVIASIAASASEKLPLVINLCDGDEVNGTPGLSIINELERKGIPFTGADAYFYEITTSKIPMKAAFDRVSVPTPPWYVIDPHSPSIQDIFTKVGSPILIKPAISGGSMGVSVSNVVETEEDLIQRVEELETGYHGWDLSKGGIFLERFIKGPEYTSFIIGSADRPDDCIIYEPIERVFHSSLPETEKFLSFDRLWEIYEKESPMPDDEHFYTYQPVPADLAKKIKELSLEAYRAVGGQGYGRLDIRKDMDSGKLFVLEVNAQCGLSEDEDYTSIGAILRVSEKTFSEMVFEIIAEAFNKQKL